MDKGKLNAKARIIQDYQIILDKVKPTHHHRPPNENLPGWVRHTELCVMSHAGCYDYTCNLSVARR
jgi:hypothetical protein